MLRNGTIASTCALLLWIGGCPKRQGSKNAVVYVPAPAPAAAPAATESQVLVIEEPPPPPEPEETPPPQTAQPTAHRRQGGPARNRAATEPDETSAPPETPETPPTQVPALEPRESSAQETELRRQFLKLEQDIRQRLTRFDAAHLSSNDRKTLDDARTFFAQSTHAMATGDLPRALNLARKASLLLAALE